MFERPQPRPYGHARRAYTKARAYAADMYTKGLVVRLYAIAEASRPTPSQIPGVDLFLLLDGAMRGRYN